MDNQTDKFVPKRNRGGVKSGRSTRSGKSGQSRTSGKGGRASVNQDSFGWYARAFLHTITFGVVKPPKTERSDNYRSAFIRKNPGLFKDGIYICAYCGKIINAKDKRPKKGMEVDHVKPLEKGGRNWTPNLVPACFKCNRAKGKKAGLWTVRGRIGKVIYTTLQVISNLLTGVFTGRKGFTNEMSKFVWIGIGAALIYATLGGGIALPFF